MMRRDEQAVFALRELYEGYGYTRYKMSRFEEYDLYVNNKDFLISDEVITFTDRSGRLLAMKPPLAFLCLDLLLKDQLKMNRSLALLDP